MYCSHLLWWTNGSLEYRRTRKWITQLIMRWVRMWVNSHLKYEFENASYASVHTFTLNIPVFSFSFDVRMMSCHQSWPDTAVQWCGVPVVDKTRSRLWSWSYKQHQLTSTWPLRISLTLVIVIFIALKTWQDNWFHCWKNKHCCSRLENYLFLNQCFTLLFRYRSQVDV